MRPGAPSSPPPYQLTAHTPLAHPCSSSSFLVLSYQRFIITWSKFFWFVDLIFLAIFIVEICLRIYAWGLSYLKDCVNLADFLIVLASFVM